MNLVEENNLILRSKIEEFKGSILDLQNYFDEMYEIMLKNDGIGLAAPQVGLSYRFFIMQKDKSYEVFLNPEIIEKSNDMIFDTEGCLSFPFLYLKIYRPKFIKVRYTNKLGNIVEDILDDINARCFIHEYEHLEGITFDQKAGDFELVRAKDNRRKIIKKKSRL